MKQFEEIGKSLPYTESEQYLDQLISRSAERAIKQAPSHTIVLRRLLYSVAAAAIILLAIVGVTQFSTKDTPQVAQTEQESPIDQFLDGITDEEAQMLAYYDIEDIPEYE